MLRAASCLPHKLQTDPQCSTRSMCATVASRAVSSYANGLFDALKAAFVDTHKSGLDACTTKRLLRDRFVEKYVCPQLYALLGNVEDKLEKQRVATARASPDAAAMRKHLEWQQAQMSPVQPLSADPHQPEFYMPQVMSRKDPESKSQVMRHVSVADTPGIYPDPVQFFNQMDLASKSHNPTQHKSSAGFFSSAR